MSDRQASNQFSFRNNPYDPSLLKLVAMGSTTAKPCRFPPHCGKIYILEGVVDIRTLRERLAKPLVEPRVRRDNRTNQQLIMDLNQVPAQVRDAWVADTDSRESWFPQIATYLRVQFNVLVTALYYDRTKQRLVLVLHSTSAVQQVLDHAACLYWDDEWHVSINPQFAAVGNTPLFQQQ